MDVLGASRAPQAWQIDHGAGELTQIWPLGDLRQHIVDGSGCWCHPTIDDDGLVVHNALDGREAYERGERKPT